MCTWVMAVFPSNLHFIALSWKLREPATIAIVILYDGWFSGCCLRWWGMRLDDFLKKPTPEKDSSGALRRTVLGWWDKIIIIVIIVVVVIIIYLRLTCQKEAFCSHIEAKSFMLRILFKTRYFHKIIGFPSFSYLGCWAFLSAVVSLILLLYVLRVIFQQIHPVLMDFLDVTNKKAVLNTGKATLDKQTVIWKLRPRHLSLSVNR